MSSAERRVAAAERRASRFRREAERQRHNASAWRRLLGRLAYRLDGYRQVLGLSLVSLWGSLETSQ